MSESKRLLIVDDEPDAVEFVMEALDREGWSIVSASDGQQGLDAATAQPPDLMILDVQMPRLDGFQLFAKLQQNPATQGVPVIMLTGIGQRTGMHFSADEMGQFMGAEPFAYVEKPIDPELLLKKVEEALGQVSAD